MDLTCNRCGSPTLQKATVIVSTQTSSGTHSGIGYVDGQSVRTSGTVNMQTDLARNLSSDQPKKVSNWLTCLGIALIMVPLFSLGLCSIIVANGPNTGIAAMVTVTCFVAAIAVGISLIVIYKIRIKKYRLRYNQWWWSVLDRRYYCNSCGTILNT